MDKILEKVFPYEGIPEIILAYISPEEKHEKGSEKLRKEMENLYRHTERDGTYFGKNFHSYDDKPAKYIFSGPTFSETSTHWYKYGKLHREGKPAVVESSDFLNSNYSEYWYRDGLLDRDNNLPAISYCNGKIKLWFRRGVLSRDIGHCDKLSYQSKRIPVLKNLIEAKTRTN